MAEQHSPPGSHEWKLVTSPDGKVFYFNSRTGQSSWTIPDAPGAPPPYEATGSAPASSYNPQHNTQKSAEGHGFSPMPQTTPTYAYSQPPYRTSSYQGTPYPSNPPNTNFGPPPTNPPHSPYYGASQPRAEGQPTTSLRSLFGGIAKAALLGGATTGPTYGNAGYSGYAPSMTMPQVSPVMQQPNMANAGAVIVNGYPLDQQAITRLQMMGTRIIPGRYWYDPRSGAWGQEGGPCLGATAAGMTLGGPLRADASGPSGTGVYINGRQIHAMDAIRLQAIGITPVPGRWWVESDGRFGLEGTFITLGSLAGGMASGGSGASSWSTSGGSFGGSDGQGFGYSGGTDSTGRSWSVSWGS